MNSQIAFQMGPIPGYVLKYEITSTGEIYSYHKSKKGEYREEPLAIRIGSDGYPIVNLSKDGVTTTYPIHRLLAIKFIPNPENKEQVNHKDGNKLNYDLSNLEWVTASENMQHAYAIGLCNTSAISKKVKDTSTGIEYPSVKEAAKALNINYSSCKNYLNGNRPNKTSLLYVS